jgi:hypothetical protein
MLVELTQKARITPHDAVKGLPWARVSALCAILRSIINEP